MNPTHTNALTRTDLSGYRVRHAPLREQQWRQSGAWEDLTVAERAQALSETRPDFVTHVLGDQRLTAAQAWTQSGHLAGALWSQGLRPGDVLAFQTPNWLEAVLIDLAASRIGLVLCPIVPIYRDREVALILQDCRAKAIFVASMFRGFDHLAMMARLRPQLPELKHLWTAGPASTTGSPSPADADLRDLLAAQHSAPTVDVSPDAIKLILYTSGTTGRPKAVLHSHNSLARSMRQAAKHWGLSQGDTTLMPSPVTHVTGFTFGLELPFCEQVHTVLMDKWDAAQAVHLIERENICFTLCATPFLQELLDLAEREGRELPSMRRFPCGGAAVPPDLINRVSRVLKNCRAFRVYGSSEAPVITLGYPELGQERLAAETDGAVIDYEVKLVRPDGRLCGDGEEGEICARGPALFLGYAAWQDTVDAFDDDGYFHTGDVGYRTAEGAIVFTGRIKDLINRGGEKISAKEVEDLLHTHPGVLEAAVVAMPHLRLGETVCAFVIAKPGADVSVNAIAQTLQATQVARQKYPESVFLVADFPRTASGKIKKDVLRELARKAEAPQSA